MSPAMPAPAPESVPAPRPDARFLRAARGLPAAAILDLLAKSAPGDGVAGGGIARATWLHRNPANWSEVLREVPVGCARDVARVRPQAVLACSIGVMGPFGRIGRFV